MNEPTNPKFDWVFRGATVIDGTGKPRFTADIGIKGERIDYVGDIPTGEGATEIAAHGKVIAPGFIDVHTHDDGAVLRTPGMEAKISQGVTTVVVGNCGISLAPLARPRSLPPPLDLIGGVDDFIYGSFADYLAAVDAATPAVNVVALVGHMALRAAVMPAFDRPATEDEMVAMERLLNEALDSGATGLSTGLWYAPSIDAPAEEVTRLAAHAGTAGGIYATHMRNEADKIIESLDESFTTAKSAGVPLIVSHHKLAGKPCHGGSVKTLDHFREAMKTQEIGLDAYPYSATSTVIRPFMVQYSEKTLITWSEPHPEHAGKYLSDIAAEWSVPDVEAAERLQPGGAVYWMLSEEDVQRILAFEHTMIGSDGLPHDQHPHPRLWGTFARVLGHYSRDLGLFTLEDAVRRMTSLPAANFRIPGRGRIAQGMQADLVMFDADTIIDRATYTEPVQPSGGIEWVMVNGHIVWSSGHATGERPGRALRRTATA